MGLFRKKVTNESEVTNQKKDNVEILDLSNEENTKVENTLEKRKENRIMFIIIGVILVFAFLLPTLTKVIKKTSIFSYNNEQKEIEENKTIDGMIEIDKEEGFIIAKKIKFYNIRKKNNNSISIVYLPQTEVNNVNDLNIYIELYNSSKNIIYRSKFTSKKTLERKVQGNFVVNLNDTIYKEATYGKIVIIKENEWTKSTEELVCEKEIIDDVYEVNYEVKYGIGSKGLVDYSTKRTVKINLTEDLLNSGKTTEELEAEYDKYRKMFIAEGDELSKTNITDLFYDDYSIEYSIDFLSFEKNNSSYLLFHDLGSTKRQIKLNEESNGWSCK